MMHNHNTSLAIVLSLIECMYIVIQPLVPPCIGKMIESVTNVTFTPNNAKPCPPLGRSVGRQRRKPQGRRQRGSGGQRARAAQGGPRPLQREQGVGGAGAPDGRTDGLRPGGRGGRRGESALVHTRTHCTTPHTQRRRRRRRRKELKRGDGEGALALRCPLGQNNKQKI